MIGREILKRLENVRDYIYSRYTLLADRPERVFLLFASVFGLVFLIVIPPMQSPDEVEHLYRSYQLSEFNLVADPVGEGYGGTLPKSVVNAAQAFKGTVAGHNDQVFNKSLIISAGLQPLAPSAKQEVRFDNIAIYSIAPYIPQTIGVGIGRLAEAPPLFLIYLGRIANLVAFIGLIYLAIRIIPVGKWAIAIIALNPMSLTLVSTLSSDAASISFVALLVAVVLRLYLRPVDLTKIQMVMIFGLILLTCLTKNIFMPLALLALFIPAKSLSKKIKIAMIGIAVVAGLVWNVTILPIADSIPQYFGLPGIDKSSQIENIVHHPISSAGTILENMFGQPSSGVVPSYTGVFGWLDTPIPFWVSLVYFTVLIAAFFYRSESSSLLSKINYKLGLGFGLFALASFAAAFVTLYVGYTPVNGNIIQGVQGRYFIPLTFLLIPILATKAVIIKSSETAFLNVIAVSLLIVMVASLVTILVRYY